MMLLFKLEKNQILKNLMRIQMFYIRDRLILKLLYLINGANRVYGVATFKKPNISPDVFLLIFRLETPKLQRNSMKTICKNPNSFFELKEFPTLNKDILLSLAKRDDMDIEEIDIWKYLLRWGTAQFVALKKPSKGDSQKMDATKRKDNNFALLKKSLDPFILYIQFHEISCEDFYYHIRPYKKAILESIYEDLVAYLIANIMPKFSNLPSRYGSIILILFN
ncbi:hypothetical protein C2G38_2280771 [Gigaspora rosea]|uniref:BACK domain-containing protein n=1 Tax=Gigaspora rosea TaxID=44941 RepID=A0A397U6R6_9GLOM|nr:hypothetical protein C2G38_2280771 [Gigaspora rosea]